MMAKHYPDAHLPGAHFPDGHFPAAAGEVSRPNPPTMTIVLAGTTATCTIAGDDDAEHQVWYMASTAAGWTSGGVRGGDGDIVIEGLTRGVTYWFIAQSVVGEYFSIPSIPVTVRPQAAGAVTATSPLAKAMEALRSLIAASATFQDALGAVGTTE